MLKQQWNQCSICGFIYERPDAPHEQKDRQSLDFASLPASWCCPDCGVLKALFKQREPAEVKS